MPRSCRDWTYSITLGNLHGGRQSDNTPSAHRTRPIPYSRGGGVRHEKIPPSPETLQSIHWEGIESALRRLPMLRRATYVKYIHDWLPTQQLLFRQSRAPSPMCKVCRDPASSETMAHLLSCPCENREGHLSTPTGNMLSHPVGSPEHIPSHCPELGRPYPPPSATPPGYKMSCPI